MQGEHSLVHLISAQLIFQTHYPTFMIIKVARNGKFDCHNVSKQNFSFFGYEIFKVSLPKQDNLKVNVEPCLILRK